MAACSPNPIDLCNLPRAGASSSELHTIVSTVLAIFGAIAFLVLVIAGFRYATSSGDPNTMTKAKDTIIYASVGLIVSMVAFVISAFVISNT